MKTAVILGAGFSKNSGMPLLSEITEFIVKYPDNNEFEYEISMVIKRFLRDVFGYNGGETIPGIDDILVTIDLCSRTGHHLGIRYSPEYLAAIRRFLMYRIFMIFHENCSYSEEVLRLIGFLHEKHRDLSYIVLNWDCVLEKYLGQVKPNAGINYCNNGKYLEPVNKNKHEENIKLLKVHGSVNWLYCDNCRVLVNDLYERVNAINKAGFRKSDFELFNEFQKAKGMNVIIEPEECCVCKDKLSSHIASLSYRKSFRENSYPNIWSEAEDVLSSSDKWIFIGYSMPQSDYEFKHILKLSQMKFCHLKKRKLEIDVVIMKSDTTKKKYQGFFGENIKNIYNGGINEYLRNT
ncbi:MAG: hypothetical protein GX660_16340 [Clostridiaceae bacterium]|nr:hypothetical protein [Clostridiaceae bacterium]